MERKFRELGKLASFGGEKAQEQLRTTRRHKKLTPFQKPRKNPPFS